MANLIIRKIKEDEWDDAMSIAWRTFLRYEAADYEQEGIDHFLEFISDERLRKMWLMGEYVVYGAFLETDETADPTMVGMVSYRNGNHLSLLFVLSQYHKQGVGRRLIEVVCQDIKSSGRKEFLTVHGAPYAIDFYHKLGFVDLEKQQYRQGIYYTPMRKML